MVYTRCTLSSHANKDPNTRYVIFRLWVQFLLVYGYILYVDYFSTLGIPFISISIYGIPKVEIDFGYTLLLVHVYTVYPKSIQGKSTLGHVLYHYYGRLVGQPLLWLQLLADYYSIVFHAKFLMSF